MRVFPFSPCSMDKRTPVPMLRVTPDVNHTNSYMNQLRHAKAKYESLARFIVWLQIDGQPPAVPAGAPAAAQVVAAPPRPETPPPAPVPVPAPAHVNGHLEPVLRAAANGNMTVPAASESGEHVPALEPANTVNGEPGPSIATSYATALSTSISSAA